ncbi:MAG TPA: epoxyqueuosine reductase QueH [Flexilinea sp.]|nr:epoxyqueuosine reductase QueH [Flexilinea sp.]
MKILLHICCAPCGIYPIKNLLKNGFDLTGFFYRHNIHPYTECVRRQEAVQAYSEKIGLRVIYQKDYDLEGFLRNVVFRESERCGYCYHDRLRTTALIAKRGRFDYFTSTLLYSRFQNHKMIKSIGESVGKSVGIPFYYEDFRMGWEKGIEESKQLGLYRQQYCGCIYSEKERFFHSSGR